MNDQNPITLRDVLRAVFMPPQQEGPHPLPGLPTQKLWAVLPGADISAATADVAELNQPTVIHYEETPIKPLTGASPRRVATLGIGVVGTILIAYLAQAGVASQHHLAGGAVFYLLAVIFWSGLLAFELAPPDGGLLRRGPRTSGAGAARPLPDYMTGSSVIVRSALAISALALSIATYVFTADNIFTPQGIICWLASVVLWLLVAAERSLAQLLQDWRQAVQRIHFRRPVLRPKHFLAAAAIIAILGTAIFFRFFRLDAIPDEMTSDHVEKLLDAYDVSQGTYHVFFPNNAGREAIQFYLIALASRLFGTGMSFLTLKMVAGIEALLLVPLVVWLGRELIDWETGFFAAALLAISWWDVALGRLALRIILTPLIFTLILLTLSRGMRSGSRRAWLWAGVWMGIGMYAYQALRMAPLAALTAFLIAVAGPLVVAIRAHFREQPDAGTRQVIAATIAGRQALNLALAGLITLAIFVPMLRFWHDSPFDMWNRVINRTTSNEVAIQGTPQLVLIDNYIDAIGMFNVKGDASWFTSVPYAPVLDTVTGVLLVLGLVAWAIRLAIRRDPVDLFLILAGLVMLLPSALALAFPEENPSLTRASGAMPVVFILAAWPLALIRQRWTSVIGKRAGTALAAALIAILIGAAGYANYHTYFIQFDQSYRNSALNPGQVARAVREVIGPEGSMEGVWLQGWPFWHDYRAIGIEAGDITFKNAILDFPMLQSYLTTNPTVFMARPLVFIIHPQDTKSLEFLKDNFPKGHAEYHEGDTEKHGFYLFIVPVGD